MADSATAAGAKGSSSKRWLKRTGIGLGITLLAGAAFIGYAEHHTAQPDFCGSCHIMEQYHETWQNDLHGTKLGVACVDCHYAPGERTTVNAKLRGLSQVASYVSGRYGATRPRAHVSNDSCLMAKCHGDGKFMDKQLDVGTVKFSHASHFKLREEGYETLEKELKELSEKLLAAVGEERFVKMEETAKIAGPHKARIDALEKLAKAAAASLERSELEHFSQLHHRRVRLDQLTEIQCTNCHTYGSKLGENKLVGDKAEHHFSVNMTSCYTCHFNNEGFNTGTNSCLMCHKQLPAGEIIVHKELSNQETDRLKSPELGGKVVKMNHQAILDRKVDCASCHADVAIEPARVSQRDCQHCHDSPRFFEKWKEPLSVDAVAEYHRVHVPNQRAKCLDCHSEIHHQLIRDEQPGDNSFMTSTMAKCDRCHPNHHQEQLQLLSGRGAAGVPKSAPNLMFGSRTNCLGCHAESASDQHGGQVMKATLNGCMACHGDRHAATFEKWKEGLEFVLSDAEETYNSARKLLDESTDITDEARQKATELLTAAGADLRLVKRGNGLHNVTYAMEVLDSVSQKAQEASRVITEGKPKKTE